MGVGQLALGSSRSCWRPLINPPQATTLTRWRGLTWRTCWLHLRSSAGYTVRRPTPYVSRETTPQRDFRQIGREGCFVTAVRSCRRIRWVQRAPPLDAATNTWVTYQPATPAPLVACLLRIPSGDGLERSAPLHTRPHGRCVADTDTRNENVSTSRSRRRVGVHAGGALRLRRPRRTPFSARAYSSPTQSEISSPTRFAHPAVPRRRPSRSARGYSPLDADSRT